MQSFARQRMVRVDYHVVVFTSDDQRHVTVRGLGDHLRPGLGLHVIRELVARDVEDLVRVHIAVRFFGLHYHVGVEARLGALQRFLQPGDDVVIAVQVDQGTASAFESMTWPSSSVSV